jgi:hypothetical protein
MSFRLETKIEPTMPRRVDTGMYLHKLTDIGETLFIQTILFE